jgi:hypothetical protein
MVLPEFAPHLPADPQQQKTAGEQQPDDLQELGCRGRKADAQNGRCDYANDDCVSALLFG